MFGVIRFGRLIGGKRHRTRSEALESWPERPFAGRNALTEITVYTTDFQNVTQGFPRWKKQRAHFFTCRRRLRGR